MKDHGMMFSAPMVLAARGGSKTQTRRLATSPLARARAGDRIWVRETYRLEKCFDNLKPTAVRDQEIVQYEADGHIRWRRREGWVPGKLRPAIHMPLWASRVTLIVADVRVEPLHAISKDDAIAEGAFDMGNGFWNTSYGGPSGHGPVGAYKALWTHLHGAESWASNPDVVVITFGVRPCNIGDLIS